tara:strand:+ start:1019 stop:1357 length:339 start_codon:yes stop_codon:yes gene_type:complete
LPLVAVVVLLTACGDSGPADRMLQQPEDLKRGRNLFVGSCMGYCHSMQDAKKDIPYLFDCEWLHGGSDDQIFTTITNGVEGTKMLGVGNKLPEGSTDTWRLVAFLKSERRPC